MTDAPEASREEGPPASPPTTRRRRLTRVAWRVLRVYLVVCLALFFLQNFLLFPRDRSLAELPLSAERQSVEEVSFETADGLTLSAWFHRGSTDLTVVFFPGNGGNREGRYEFMQLVSNQGASVLQVEYRGYGGNPGKPSEAGLYRDAEAAIAWARANTTGPMIFYGESLGTGVAVEMATRHQPAGVVLHASYSSIPDVARRTLFLFPTGLICRHRFESAQKIGDLEMPLLFFHGSRDTVIPQRFGGRLFQAARAEKDWVVIPGAGHNDLWFVDIGLYFGRLRTFFDECRTAAGANENR